MTLSALYTILSATGYPVAYSFFPDDERVSPPCITYEVAFSDNFGADNHVFSPFNVVDIFLFTKIKDETAEGKVEKALDDNYIFWDKTETYNNDEKVYQIIYEVKINAS